MKKVVIGLLAASMAVSTFAGINIMWDTGGFLSGLEGNIPLLGEDDDTVEVLWDLIYTSDSTSTVAPTPVLNTSADNLKDAVSYGDNSVVSSRYLADASVTKDNLAIEDVIASDFPTATADNMEEYGYLYDYNNTYRNATMFKIDDVALTSGGLYSAIFQLTSDNRVFYALTPVFTDASLFTYAGGNGVPDEVCFDLTTSSTKLSYLDTLTSVPEPATMALLGLGGLAMVIRRKLRK